MSEPNLFRGENVVFSTKLHWSIYILPTILVPFFGIGIIFLFLAWLIRRSSQFVVTSKRVICETGLLRKQSVEILLTKVETIKLENGLFTNCGTITIVGAGGTKETFKNVANAKGFRQAVNEAVSA